MLLTSLFVAALLIVVLASVLMTAPSATARGTPTGKYAPDGYRSLVTFALAPTLNIWEIEGGTPPGRDNGTPINLTTMWNDDHEMYAPQALNVITGGTFKFAYDPGVQETLKTLTGANTVVTQRFYDGTTHAYHAFLQKIQFDPLVRGQVPTGTITIMPTGMDPSTRTEEDILVTDVTGS